MPILATVDLVNSEFVFGRLPTSQNGIGLIGLEGPLSLLFQKGNFFADFAEILVFIGEFSFSPPNSKLAI